jgi:hypothetical protein
MITVKKSVLGGMNQDDASQYLEDDAYLNLMNARVVSVSETGRGQRGENVPGTTAIVQTVYPPYGVSFPIGSGIDDARGRIIYVVQNTSDDNGIYCFDRQSGITYAVLYDSQVLGGLNLSKSFRVDRNARVVGDLFYWTDNNNDQRRINIEAGIKMNLASYNTEVEPYSYPMNPEVLTVIRRPPALPLFIQKFEEVGSSIYNNFVKDFSGEFSYRYYYRDGEISVLSTYSPLANYNSKAELYNRIDITFPLLEQIDQDVQRVDLVVRYGNSNNFFVVNSWDKDNATQAAEIAAHNSGTALTYRFYNNKTGEALAFAYVVKPFDSVPLRSKTLEVADQRLFLGNNVIGYDTPTTTSLSAEFAVVEDGGSVDGEWYELSFDTGSTVGTYYVLKIDNIGADSGYYTVLPYPGPEFLPVPTTVDYITELFFLGTDPLGIVSYWGLAPGDVDSFTLTPYTATVTNPPSNVNLIGVEVYKTNAPYRLGVVFYDFADRKCGVVTAETNIYTTPEREYATLSYATLLNWALSNTNALNEIPEWATHYSIVMTKCLRTRFFLVARAKNATYAFKSTAGVYTFLNTTYTASASGIGLDITLLESYGMGYVFAQGDLVKIYIGTDVFTSSIIGQDGGYIICELQDIGNLTTPSPYTDTLFEIYTPYQETVNESFYEVGQTYLVNNPGTSSREYSTLLGSISGDVTILSRSTGSATYLTENMSPNDTYYSVWNTDSGRVNIITNQGQSSEPNTIAYSNVYIEGTANNGMSSFDALDEKNLPNECGPLEKLQVTSKVSEQGHVMLAICRNETASMYLSEVQVVGADSNAFLAQAIAVIGTVNILKGSYGTVNPESVIEFRGLVWWFDALNGKVVQYSANGLFPVSDFKMARFWQRYSAAYLEADTNNLDNINGFHHVASCIDPFTNELLITVPALIYENYANILPSYSSVPSYASSIINRFDIYDQLGKTMSFDFIGNKWRQNYEYMPDWMDYLQTGLYGYKNNCTLYLHNSDTTNWNTWYGTQYPVRLCQSWNIEKLPSAIKDVFDTALECNAAPDFSVLYATYPWIQISDLTDSDYDNPEGVFYAMWFRDRLSPNVTGTADERLYKGDIVKSDSPMTMLEFHQYTSLFYITFSNLGFQISKGTQALIK